MRKSGSLYLLCSGSFVKRLSRSTMTVLSVDPVFDFTFVLTTSSFPTSDFVSPFVESLLNSWDNVSFCMSLLKLSVEAAQRQFVGLPAVSENVRQST